MTTYYVNGDTGNDGTGDGTNPSTPYLKISAAYNAVANGDIIRLQPATYDQSTQGNYWALDFDEEKAVTIMSDSTTVTCSSGGGALYDIILQIDNDVINTITNLNIIADRANTNELTILRRATKTGSLVSNQCIFSQTAAGVFSPDLFIENLSAKQGGSIEFYDCTITGIGKVDFIIVGDIDLIKFDNTSLVITADSEAPRKIFDFSGNCKAIEIVNGSTINTEAVTEAGYGRIFNSTAGTTGTATIEKILIRDSTLAAHATCLTAAVAGHRKIDINNSVLSSETEHCVYLGLSTLNEFSINVKVNNSTLTSVAANTSGLVLGIGCEGAEASYNRITGLTHTFNINASYCSIHHNISTGGLAIINGGRFNNIFNNTLIGGDGATYLSGSYSGASENGNRNAKGTRFYNNIVVQPTTAKYCYRDYEGRYGDQTQLRGSSVDLNETTTATDIDAVGVMTGTGSAWATDGPKLVREGDIVRFTAGTGVVLGDYVVKSITSNTVLTLYSYPGFHDGSAEIDLVYKILRGDLMDDYVDHNCYFHELGEPLAEIGYTGATQHEAVTLADMQAAWGGAWDGDTEWPGRVWNPDYTDINDQNSINADPLFVDAAGGDYSLKPNSPCWNAGFDGATIGADIQQRPPHFGPIRGTI